MTLKRRTKRGIFLAGILFVPVVHFVIFWVAVNFNSILLAFQRFDTTAGKEYFTFDNFKALGTLFGKFGPLSDAMLNTFLTWAFLTLFLLPWSFFITYFLYKKIRLSGLWRTMLFVPTLLPAVAMTSIFMYLLGPEAPVGKLFGESLPAFLNEDGYAKWTVIFYIFLTGFGWQFILLSGAMSRVPNEVIESARIDGAGLRVEMLKMVLPLCWPTISMLLLLNIAGFFTASGPILLLTNGGAKTTTMAFYFYYTVRDGVFYEPAAVGILFTLLIFPVVLLARWALGKVYADVEF